MVRRRLPAQARQRDRSWEQVSSRDIQRRMAWLLDRCSTAYASNQYRDLCFYTARSYSLMRAPRTARRLIYSSERTRDGGDQAPGLLLSGLTRGR